MNFSASHTPAAPKGSSAALAGLLFASGSSALIYELIWFKRLAQLWGSSGFALGAVVGAFLLGLGLGARWAGQRADGLRSPLRAYACCEAFIAVCALLSLSLFQLGGRGLAVLYEPLASLPGGTTAARLVLAFVVLAPPCLAMGATLPLVIAELSQRGEGTGRATALLYATNTFGAATGCLLAGFYLLPSFGLVHTLQGAALFNGVVAFAAFALARRSKRAEALTAPTEPGARTVAGAGTAEGAAVGLPTAAFLLGAGALCLHVVWNRQLAVCLGGTTYAFTAMLFVVLVGIAAGSALARRLVSEGQRQPRLLALLLVLGVVFTVAGQRLVPSLSVWVGEQRGLRSSPWGNAFVCITASAVIQLLPSLVSGALLPLLVGAVGGVGNAGRSAGRLFAANTLGASLFAVLASNWLLPFFGRAGLEGFAIGLQVVAITIVAHGSSGRPRLVALLLVAAAISIPALMLRGHDPRQTQTGQYLYGPQIASYFEDSETVSFESGRLADVWVAKLASRHGEIVSLRLDGKVDASSHPSDSATQLGTAYLARIFAPRAREVLVVGYGSGGTVGASLLFPSVERVTCLEIEPAVLRASPAFEPANHEPRSSSALRMVIDDARSFVQGARSEEFDLILTEPSNPWMPGVANLFTLEFYTAVRERLREGGVLAQWVQTYALELEDYALVARTLLEVFPHAVLFEVGPGDTLLIASESSPVLPSPEALEQAGLDWARIPAARADLAQLYGVQRPIELLLGSFLLGEDELRALAQEAPPGFHSDTNLRLEYDAPLSLFREEDGGLSPLALELRRRAEVSSLEALAARYENVPVERLERRKAEFLAWD